MKNRIVFLFFTLFVSSMLSWGQTWEISKTMTATLDSKGVMTISTTAASEEMPDFEQGVFWPWEGVRGNIVSLVIEENVTVIGEMAFFNCWSLKSATIPNSLTTIKAYAFGSCHQLEDIILPNSLTVIEGHAFQECWGFTFFNFPDKLTTIGTSAFYGCSELSEILIPASVTSIGNGAFMNCEKLEAVNIEAANSKYSSGDGILYDKDQEKLIFYPGGKKDVTFAIPGTVNIIEVNACLGAKFSSVIIPDAVAFIGSAAFYESNLTSIVIPKSVEGIGYKVFAYCSNLTSIEVEAGSSDYSSEAGVLYNKDKTILYAYPAGKKGDFTIPATVTDIDGYAFSGASGLTSVTMPNSVITIEEYVFDHCSGLTSLAIPGSVNKIGRNAFNNCTGLEEVKVEWETPYFVPMFEDLFWGVDHSASTLYVPTGTKMLYQVAETWKNFGTIVEYVLTGIEAIKTPTLKACVSDGIVHITGLKPGMLLSIYTLSGQLVYKGIANAEEEFIPLNTSGIYIVKAGEKVAKIVMSYEL